MEIQYTDEFNRQGTVYFVNDSVNEQVQYVDSDSDTMSTCSSRSVSTITSSDVSDFYQERHGRVFPRDHNIPRILPIDEPEHDRLEKTHEFLKLLVGSNYWGPMQEVMRSKPHPRVLDLRTQGGSWVQEMATEFPHAHFTSLDLVPMVPHAPRPNVTFEIYDLYAGLAEPDESFDVIHARDCVCWVKNYDLLLREFHRVLRPGGLLLIGELGYDIYEAYDTDVTACGSAPRIHAGLEMIKEAARSQGVMVDSLPLVPKWLAPDSELWTTQSPPGSPAGQPPVQRRKRGFTNIETRPVAFPNGRWHPDPLMQRIGGMAQEVWHSAWYSVTPMLLERGMDAELVRDTIEGAMQELMDPTIQTVWKYMMIHCIKA